MPSLTLSIQNMDRLPDGGPLEISVKGQRGIDIGRDPYLDWTLPDPGRIVSSRHCEVRFRDGAYWLHDISSNGTFLNSSELRMSAPHRLADGDRIDIGHYIIGAKVELDAGQAEPSSALPIESFRPEAMWDTDSTAPPISAAELRPPRPAAEQSDLMNWFVDIPQVDDAPRSREPVWLETQPQPQTPAPSPVFEAPRVAAPMPPASAPAMPAPAIMPAPESEPGFDALPPLVADSPTPGADWSITPLPEPPEPALPPLASPGGYMTAPPAAIMAEMQRPAPPPAPVQPPPVAPQLAPAPPRSQPLSLAGGSLGALMARGAGVGEDVFSRRSPEEMAELAGLVLRLTCENLKQMLAARAETKGLVRSTNQTMIQALENNPLKFSPSAEDALRTMFGPPTTSYLDARRAIEDSFRDLKSHQINTYAAMQQALKLLVEDLDPAAIESATDKEGGLGGLMSSRKAKLWDHFVTRWKAKTERHDNGLVDAFMLYFSECYDRLASKLRS